MLHETTEIALSLIIPSVGIAQEGAPGAIPERATISDFGVENPC